MKIGINALGLRPSTMGGLEIYFHNLLKNISGSESDDEYHIFLNNKALKRSLQHYVNERLKLVYFFQFYTYAAGALLLFLSRPKNLIRLVLNQLIEAVSPGNSSDMDTSGIYGKIIDLNRFGMDVIHFPFATIDPSFSNIRASLVLTIPDIQHEYYPEFFGKEILQLRKKLYRSSAERADIIITISESAKNSLIEKYGMKPEKCIIAYPSCSPGFKKIQDMTLLAAAKTKYALPDEFLFYPAGTWPHKNHLKLLEALVILKNKYSFEQKLIMTGIAQNNHQKVMDCVMKLNLEKQVLFLNVVPFNDLPSIYNLATMMVFPSLFEGFGIPLLEAMNVGVPIACSDRTSVPEVVGDAGLYFNPENEEDIADKVHHLWHDNALKENLVMKGFERAKQFTPENTVERTLAAYSLAGRKHLS